MPVSEPNNVFNNEWYYPIRNKPDEIRKLRLITEITEVLDQKKQITGEDLRPVIDATMSKHACVWEEGATLLLRLAARHNLAQQALIKISNAPTAADRFKIMSFLRDGQHVPHEIKVQLLTHGLADKSSKVREFAANSIDALELKELLPMLEKAYVEESNSTTRSVLHFAIQMLRNGYATKDLGAGKFSVTVKLKQTYRVAVVDENAITQDLPGIVAKLRHELAMEAADIE